MLLFIPVFFLVFARLAPRLSDNPGTLALWLSMTGAAAAMFFCVMFWAKRVPTIYSATAAVIVWVITLWLALTNRFVGP